MKRFQKTAVAFAIAAIAPIGIASDLAVEDVATVEVQADIDDFIYIKAENDNPVVLSGDNVSGGWSGTKGFSVERRGAIFGIKSMPYELHVKGPQGSNNNGFKLTDTVDESLSMRIDVGYRAHERMVTNPLGEYLPINHNDKVELETQRRLDSKVPGNNLYVKFSVPESELQKAQVGSYTGAVTFMVTAI